MKELRLLKALGRVDEEYVEESSYPRRTKKTGWIRWGAMAACVCIMICVFTFPRLFEHPNDSTSGDISSMIYINDTLYRIPSSQPDLTGKENQFVYLGEISSKVNSSQYPTENFQANDDIVGALVYQYGVDIVVLINNEYCLYEVK